MVYCNSCSLYIHGKKMKKLHDGIFGLRDFSIPFNRLKENFKYPTSFMRELAGRGRECKNVLSS